MWLSLTCQSQPGTSGCPSAVLVSYPWVYADVSLFTTLFGVPLVLFLVLPRLVLFRNTMFMCADVSLFTTLFGGMQSGSITLVRSRLSSQFIAGLFYFEMSNYSTPPLAKNWLKV